MRKSSFRALALAGAVLAVGASVLAPTAANAAGGTYYPSGPQVNVPLSTVTNGGWTLCWSSDMATSSSFDAVIGGTAAGSQSACDGDTLLLTGWANSDPSNLIVLAAAPKADVLTQTAHNTPRLANGSYWYNEPGQSIGFSESASICQSEADVCGGNQRLSWHMVNAWGDSGGPNWITHGYRFGTIRGLNDSTDYTRAIFKQQPSLHKGSKTNAGTLGRALKVTTPAGGSLVVSVSDASSGACSVSGNKLYAFGTGACEVTVTSLKANGDTKVSKSKTYVVN